MVDGGVITGEIEVWIPGERVVVVTSGGERLEFHADRVREVRFDPQVPQESPTASPWPHEEVDPPTRTDAAPSGEIHVIRRQPTAPLPTPPASVRSEPADDGERARLLARLDRLRGTREPVGGAVTLLVLGLVGLNAGIALAILGSKRAVGSDSFWGHHCVDGEPFQCERSGAQRFGLVGIAIGILGLGFALLSFRSRATRRSARDDQIRSLERRLELSADGFRLRF